jgi:cell division protein FtsB
MKPLTYVLAGLLIALQYPLWLGKGSWTRVWELDRQLAEHKAGTARLKARNGAIDAEVRDLKQGFDALEERARSELGMIRKDEVFFQVVTR